MRHSGAVPAINPPLGLDGYCPVVLSERQQWALGDRRWGAIHRGRTYLFTGPEEQRRFFTDPDRYAPAFSGNDVVLATEQGQPVPGSREHGVFFGNRVYLFSSEATLDKFARNPILYANQASGAVRTGANAGPASSRTTFLTARPRTPSITEFDDLFLDSVQASQTTQIALLTKSSGGCLPVAPTIIPADNAHPRDRNPGAFRSAKKRSRLETERPRTAVRGEGEIRHA